MKQRKTLSKCLRNMIKHNSWSKKDSCCYISGRTDNLQSHHSGVNFAFIVANSLTELNLPCYKYKDQYTDEQLALIVKEVKRQHNLYCKNITLNSEIHKELHKMYGDQVTNEQLEEFKENYIKNNNLEVA